MPELPEVETTKNGISPYLKGFTIERIVVRQPKLRWPVSPELIQIFQQKVTALSRRAKYLIIHTEQGYIIGHLGMSGSVRIVPHNSPIDKHDHLDIVMNNGKLMRYNDPLSEQFNADYLFNKSRQKTTAIKTFIMDNAIVVGVGNIYANESLFLCGLHPIKAAGKLTKAQCELLVSTIKQVLSNAIEQGGTTLKDFLQPDGRPGYFAQQLLVYGNKDKPCPKCGAKIESLVIGQRNSFYCPKCQKK